MRMRADGSKLTNPGGAGRLNIVGRTLAPSPLQTFVRVDARHRPTSNTPPFLTLYSAPSYPISRPNFFPNSAPNRRNYRPLFGRKSNGHTGGASRDRPCALTTTSFQRAQQVVP